MLWLKISKRNYLEVYEGRKYRNCKIGVRKRMKTKKSYRTFLET